MHYTANMVIPVLLNFPTKNKPHNIYFSYGYKLPLYPKHIGGYLVN